MHRLFRASVFGVVLLAAGCTASRPTSGSDSAARAGAPAQPSREEQVGAQVQATVFQALRSVGATVGMAGALDSLRMPQAAPGLRLLRRDDLGSGGWRYSYDIEALSDGAQGGWLTGFVYPSTETVEETQANTLASMRDQAVYQNVKAAGPPVVLQMDVGDARGRIAQRTVYKTEYALRIDGAPMRSAMYLVRGEVLDPWIKVRVTHVPSAFTSEALDAVVAGLLRGIGPPGAGR